MKQKVAGLTVFEQVWAKLEANKKQVAWGSAVVAVVALVVSYYTWSQAQKNVQAGQALSAVMADAMPGGGRTESAEAYLKVVAEYPRTSAAARAALAAAGTLFAQEKYAEAQAEFQKFTRDYPDSPFRGQALLGVAASLDAQGKMDEAARAYKELIDRHPSDIVVPQAKFELARVYEAQNRIKEALELYEELSRTHNYNSLGGEADLKVKELKSKVPAAVTPAAKPSFPILSAPLPGQTNKHDHQ